MNDSELTNSTPPGEVYEVGSFRPEDAEGIAELFRAVYGEAYPVKIFYDPQALTQANSDGTYYSIVARTADCRVVGAAHVFRSAPYEALYELGGGLVSREHRNRGVNRRMFEFAAERLVPQQQGIEEAWVESVCNHVIQQKTAFGFHYIETALELALMPAEAYDEEKSAAGRVAALPAFRCSRPHPHTVYLPSVYENEVKFLYSALDDERTILISDRSLPESIESHADMTVFDFAGLCRIAVRGMGSDFDTCMAKLEEKALDRNVVVLQAWLNLGSPSVGHAVDVLKRRGYFLGGLLPRWFGEDGLLMQKILVDPCFDSVHLYSDRAKQMFAMVQADWLRAQQG